jgi:hypothetical protein
MSQHTWNLVQNSNISFKNYPPGRTSYPITQQLLCDNTGEYLIGVGALSTPYSNQIIKLSHYGIVVSDVKGIDPTNSRINADCIAADASLQYIVVGTNNDTDQGYIYRSEDYGTTFSILSQSQQCYWTAITSDATGSNLVAIGSSPAIICSSTDSGATWNTEPGGVNGYETWLSVTSSSSGQYVYAGESDSNIYISNNYGNDFSKYEQNFDANQLVCSSNGQYVYAVDTTAPPIGGIYASSDWGHVWTQLDTPFLNRLFGSISCDSTGRYVLASMEAPAIRAYMSTDFGKTWNALENIPQCDTADTPITVKISPNHLQMYCSIWGQGTYSAKFNKAPILERPRGITYDGTNIWAVGDNNGHPNRLFQIINTSISQICSVNGYGKIRKIQYIQSLNSILMCAHNQILQVSLSSTDYSVTNIVQFSDLSNYAKPKSITTDGDANIFVGLSDGSVLVIAVNNGNNIHRLVGFPREESHWISPIRSNGGCRSISYYYFEGIPVLFISNKSSIWAINLNTPGNNGITRIINNVQNIKDIAFIEYYSSLTVIYCTPTTLIALVVTFPPYFPIVLGGNSRISGFENGTWAIDLISQQETPLPHSLFNGLSSIVITLDGIIMTDTKNNAIRLWIPVPAYTLPAYTFTLFPPGAGNGRLTKPRGITNDDNSIYTTIWVVGENYGVQSLFSMDFEGTLGENIALPVSTWGYIEGIVYYDNYIYMCSKSSRKIIQYDTNTGEISVFFDFAIYSVAGNPKCITTADDGYLYVGVTNGVVLKINIGDPSIYFNFVSHGVINGPIMGISYTGGEYMYLCTSTSIYQIESNGNASQLFTNLKNLKDINGRGILIQPSQLEIFDEPDIYTLAGDPIKKGFKDGTTAISSYGSQAALFNGLSYITLIQSNGPVESFLIMSDTNNDAIRMIPFSDFVVRTIYPMPPT